MKQYLIMSFILSMLLVLPGCCFDRGCAPKCRPAKLRCPKPCPKPCKKVCRRVCKWKKVKVCPGQPGYPIEGHPRPYGPRDPMMHADIDADISINPDYNPELHEQEMMGEEMNNYEDPEAVR